MLTNVAPIGLRDSVAAEYDVIVVGAGPAGIGASLAAARMGMKVLAIEQFNCIGGVATAGGHGHISNYEEVKTRRRIVGGIANEIADRIVAEGFGVRNAHAVDFEVEGLKFLMERMFVEAGIDVLYYTFFCESVVEKGMITGVVVQSKSGRQLIKAKRIIDCTGDGDVAASAGCPYEVGRPSDGKCQPVTLMFTLGGIDWKRAHGFQMDYIHKNPDNRKAWKLEPLYAEAIKNGDMDPFQTGHMGWWYTPTRPDQLCLNITHVIYVDTCNASHLTTATMEARRQAYKTLDVYRKYIPGMENAYMVSTPNTIGLRESRRIMGDYLLTDKDIETQAEFADAICYGSFYCDIHGIDGPGMDPNEKKVPAEFRKYQIPYRVLTPLNVENLLVAGRCISCTHMALAGARVMVPCIAEGEAAGIGAALSIQHGVGVREIPIAALQKRIRETGGILCEEDIVKANCQAEVASC